MVSGTFIQCDIKAVYVMTPPLPLPALPLLLSLSFPLSFFPPPPPLPPLPTPLPPLPLPPPPLSLLPLLPFPRLIFSEQLWQAISKSWGALGSEQDQFNQALRNHIKWNTTSLNTTSPDALCNQKYGWRGISEKITDFSLLLLPQSQFCRGSCCDGSGYDLSDLYVAHGGGGRTGDTNRKVLYSQSRGVWFLRRNWRKFKRSSSTGVDWLRQLSTL